MKRKGDEDVPDASAFAYEAEPVARFASELDSLQRRWAKLATESGNPLEQNATRALTSVLAALAFGDAQKLEALAEDAADYRRACQLRDHVTPLHPLARKFTVKHTSQVGSQKWEFSRPTNFSLPPRDEFLAELLKMFEATQAGGRPLASAMSDIGGRQAAQHRFLVRWLLQHWPALETGRAPPTFSELSEALRVKGRELQRRKVRNDPHAGVRYATAACLNAVGVSDEGGVALERAKSWLRTVKRNLGGK